MNYLLDTHVLLWTFLEPHKVRPEIREIYRKKEVRIFYSLVSLWEIAIKFRSGKINLGMGRTPTDFLSELEASSFLYRPLAKSVVITSHRLPRLHGDPFDRLIIWDAISSGFTLISDDSRFTQYRRCGLLLL